MDSGHSEAPVCPATTVDAPCTEGLKAVSPLAKAVTALSMLLLYYGSQLVTRHVQPLVKLFPSSLQQYSWFWVYDHHLVQLLFALALIGLLGRGRFSQFGLNFRNAGTSWRILWKFCLYYSVLVFFVNVAQPLFTRQAPTFNYAINTANVIGWLSFEWLFVGISEEILFRGLIQTWLTRTWRGTVKVGHLAIPSAGIVTTIIFCLAHIDPFHPHISWPQQVWAFGLGLYYSTVYHRTGSLLNPVLAHNFSDGIIYTALYLLYWGLR